MKIRSQIRSVLFFYESRIAPWIAIWFGWLYRPLYRILKKCNVCFVINIAGGTGHILCELDLFIRLLHQKKIDPAKRYVWIRKNDPFSSVCAKNYGQYFWFVKTSYLLYELLLPLTIRFKDITLDCGLSGLQWQLDRNGKYIRPIPGQNYLNLIPLLELNKLWNRYFQLRSSTINYFPLVTKIAWGKLENLLGDPLQRRVLVHIKEKQGNATLAATDPNSYLETLQYFYSKDFQIVFVGREKMPDCFKDFSVINYSESSLASFRHDIAIFQSCEMAIIGGSGIAYLADCYNKPYLYINSWHIATPVFSPSAIVVPTLLKKHNGEFLSFQEQIDLFLTTQPDGVVPSLGRFFPRNATSAEILAAVFELEQLIKQPGPRTVLQESVKKLGRDTPLSYAASRFSEFFLQQHQHLVWTP